MIFSDVPFRVRLGITGHRVLPRAEPIAAAIRKALKARIWDLFDRPIPPKERTTPLAFTILSPLAEGADRLAAREVLTIPGSVLEAVLPFDVEDYARTFAAAESKAEFEELRRRSNRVSVLGPSPAAGDGAAAEEGPEHEQAYETVGRHVVDHCDVLIAVWDGKPSRGPGGTAEIVAYARRKKRPLIIMAPEDPDRMTLDKGEGLCRQAYLWIRAFNRFSVSDAEARAYLDNVQKELFAPPEGDGIPKGTIDKIRRDLLPWYVRASILAKRNRKIYFRAGLTVYALSPMAVAAVAAAMLAPGMALPAFLAELIILLAIYGVIHFADKRKAHKTWIGARFLAERIRSTVFLHACGVKPAGASPPIFLKPAGRGDDWTCQAFDEINRRAGEPEPGERGSCAACVSFLRSRWIGAQIAFHTAKAEKAGRLSRILEKAGRWVFLAAIAVAAGHLGFFAFGHGGILSLLEKPLVFLAITLPAAGAALGAVRTHREYSRLESRSRRMAEALRALDGRIAAAADFAELEPFMREAEGLILQENLDWQLLMAFVRLESA